MAGVDRGMEVLNGCCACHSASRTSGSRGSWLVVQPVRGRDGLRISDCPFKPPEARCTRQRLEHGIALFFREGKASPAVAALGRLVADVERYSRARKARFVALGHRMGQQGLGESAPASRREMLDQPVVISARRPAMAEVIAALP